MLILELLAGEPAGVRQVWRCLSPMHELTPSAADGNGCDGSQFSMIVTAAAQLSMRTRTHCKLGASASQCTFAPGA